MRHLQSNEFRYWNGLMFDTYNIALLGLLSKRYYICLHLVKFLSAGCCSTFSFTGIMFNSIGGVRIFIDVPFSFSWNAFDGLGKYVQKQSTHTTVEKRFKHTFYTKLTKSNDYWSWMVCTTATASTNYIADAAAHKSLFVVVVFWVFMLFFFSCASRFSWFTFIWRGFAGPQTIGIASIYLWRKCVKFYLITTGCLQTQRSHSTQTFGFDLRIVRFLRDVIYVLVCLIFYAIAIATAVQSQVSKWWR